MLADKTHALPVGVEHGLFAELDLEWIEAAQRTVESVNSLSVTSTSTLEIRDDILNGGSDVLAGFRQALDAMTSDDTTAADAAGQLVDQGVTELDAAKQELDRALGSSSGSS